MRRNRGFLVRGDVEADPATIDKLGMEAGSHRLADEGIAFEFDQQLGDPASQRLDLIPAILFVWGCGQVRNVVEDALGKGDKHLAGRVVGHLSGKLDAEFG
jgi:hypothetical protein